MFSFFSPVYGIKLKKFPLMTASPAMFWCLPGGTRPQVMKHWTKPKIMKCVFMENYLVLQSQDYNVLSIID